jgi:putative transposase
VIRRLWAANYEVYVTARCGALRREGHVVARCTVARLMRELGPAGAVRGRGFKRTTQPDTAAPRPADLVERDFAVAAANRLWVSDLERHEAPVNRAVVKGHRLGPVAAGQ